MSFPKIQKAWKMSGDQAERNGEKLSIQIVWLLKASDKRGNWLCDEIFFVVKMSLIGVISGLVASIDLELEQLRCENNIP